MPFELIPYDDERLYTPAAKFNFKEPPMDPKHLYDMMKETLIKLEGVGLSANQVGLPHSMFVMGAWHDPDNIVGVFNPRIIDGSQELTMMEEGCLSLPGVRGMVLRNQWIKVRYEGFDGVTRTEKFQDLSARIFQHEFDHLQGKTILWGSSRPKLELLLRKLTKRKIPVIYKAGLLYKMNNKDDVK